MSTDGCNQSYPEPTDSSAGVLRDAGSRERWVDDDAPSPQQIEIYRQMTPGRRLEIDEQLYWSARRMKTAWLRTLHSDWTNEQVEAEVTRNFSHARS